MSSLRVAVTGGSGRVGSAVIRELISRGHTAINLDRRQAENPLCRFVYADLRRREQVQPVLEQVDAVCHLAEIPHSHAPYSPDEIFTHNVTTGSVVMQTAADLRLKHIVYTSSMQVYGQWGPPPNPPMRHLPFDETHPVQPTNVYSLGKVANESYARLVSDALKTSISIFRLPATWAWEINERSMRWFRHEDDGPVHEFQTYLHVSDAATAYANAVEKQLPGCELYHFSADDVVSLKPLTDRLRKNHPDAPQLPVDWPPFRSPILTDKARSKLDWAPKWSFLDEYAKKKGHDPRLAAV